MNNRDYNYVISELRKFFDSEGFTEVECQSTQSILSACEDPKSVVTYQMDGLVWPNKQTNQMELEKILLKNPELEKVYCVTTSYRDEMRVEEGRHLKIFPMFEFESRGNFEDLKKLEIRLVKHLGIADDMVEMYYDMIVAKYQDKHVTSDIERKISEDISNSMMITRFPRYTNPFWNMAEYENDKNFFKKSDVILHGMETIGSAERSRSESDMYNNFYSICDGEYAEILFHKFGKDRVLRELDAFLSLSMIERFGGGIGISRLIRSLRLKGVIK